MDSQSDSGLADGQIRSLADHGLVGDARVELLRILLAELKRYIV